MRKTFLILLSMFIAGTLYAQEAQKDKVFAFKDFAGGIATKLSDVSTKPKYARIAENVRLNNPLTAISKRNQLYLYGTADASEPITGIHRLYLVNSGKVLLVTHGDEVAKGNDSTGDFTTLLSVTFPSYRWQWLTWHNLAIGGDGYNSPVKTDGTDATYIGSVFAEATTAGAGPNGTYTYKVSCHATTQSIQLDQISNSVTVSNKDVDLSMLPIGPDTINGEAILNRNIYRNTVATPTTWQLLSNGRIANNTATTLTDSDADGALGINYGVNGGTAETWTPPKGKLCLIHKNRLWFANNPSYPSRIYYSQDGSHDMFDPLAYFNVRTNDGDEITFIKNLLGILTVGKTNTIQKIYTDKADPDSDWSITDPFGHIGCDAMYSADDTPLGILYLSRAKDGIYLFNGQSSTLKSEQATPVIRDILTSNLGSVWGEYNNNTYYMAYASNETGGSTNNRMLVYDMLADAFTIDTVSLNCLTSFTGSADGGELVAGSSLDGRVFTFETSAQEVIHNKHSDFPGVHCQMNPQDPLFGIGKGVWCHARYIPESIGGDPNSPVLEVAWHDTVDEQRETNDGRRGDIDRSAGNGSYISAIISTAAATAYDKFYWNELIPDTTHVSIAIRSGSSHTACMAASWSSEYTNSSGSDISGVTASDFTQYRLSLGCNLNLDYTPNIYTLGGYTVKLTYQKIGEPAETGIAMHWQTGYLDFGVPGYKKGLRKLIVYLEGTNGTVSITFTNEHGDTDTFDIDLAVNPYMYQEYFTTGVLTGTKFKMDIVNSDLNEVTIKEIILVMDVEPYV